MVAKKTTNNLVTHKKQQERNSGGGVPLCWGGGMVTVGRLGPKSRRTTSLTALSADRCGRQFFVFILLIVCIFTKKLILFGIGVEKNVYICKLKIPNDYEYCNIEQPA